MVRSVFGLTRFHCISIEINVKNGKNIIVSCLDRTLASSIELFNEHNENLLIRVKRNKLCYLVGDFNINLIKVKLTQGQEILLIYCLALKPYQDLSWIGYSYR